jgi:hypothetical protein
MDGCEGTEFLLRIAGLGCGTEYRSRRESVKTVLG